MNRKPCGAEDRRIPRSADSAGSGLMMFVGWEDTGGGRRIDLHLKIDEGWKDVWTNSRRTDWSKDGQNSNKNNHLNLERVPLIRQNHPKSLHQPHSEVSVIQIINGNK